MKTSNERSLKQALEGLVEDYGLRAKLDEQAVRAFWAETVGEMIARHTLSLKLRKGVLTVQVDSAPLREELGFMRITVKELINRRLEREVVAEVRVA